MANPIAPPIRLGAPWRATSVQVLDAQGGVSVRVTTYFANRLPEYQALHDARAYRLGWLPWRDAGKFMPC